MIRKSPVVYSEYLVHLRKNNTNILCHGRGMPDCENKSKISDLKALKVLPNVGEMNTRFFLLIEIIHFSVPTHTTYCKIIH